MSSLLSSHESAIKLLFDARTYVAGERISGVVELDYRVALEDKIEQVRVKLRGFATTQIVRNRGQINITYRSSLPLAHGDHRSMDPGCGQLSSRGDAHNPTPDATISYGIEVVADRPGLFRFNRRLGSVFPVLSLATREEAENAFRLRQGWSGEWKTIEHSEQIRKHLWGERSFVQAQLQHPAINSFPAGIPIPISLIVTTITKTMSKSDTPKDAFSADPDKPLFPAPPQGTDGISFLLDAVVHVKAQSSVAGKEAYFPPYLQINFLTAQSEPGFINDHLPSSAVGFGESNTSSRHVQVAHSEPVWLPDADKGEEGKWKRQVRFDTTMLLKCPPTIDLGIIRCCYVLKIEIPFPGLGNDLKFQVPININSGLGPHDPKGPAPQALDLPPSYFTGEHHNWDGEGKSG
ncbi:hypothetical protein BKA70DRAFT_1459594 [Coprinopsis sp. MPI-PUGE-AT-0042]|nr:hypothetical protein BKA70DRAFT_1459594 [Coprinopsis sp. MPI-PUGE-AT-0042]